MPASAPQLLSQAAQQPQKLNFADTASFIFPSGKKQLKPWKMQSAMTKEKFNEEC